MSNNSNNVDTGGGSLNMNGSAIGSENKVFNKMAEAPKYDQRGSNFGNFVDTAQTGSHVQSIQHNYASEQKQDLAKAAEEIQRLLKVLESTNPNATQADKQAFVTAAIAPEHRSRIVRALEAGGEKALEEFLKNPYVNVVVAIVKGWQEGK